METAPCALSGKRGGSSGGIPHFLQPEKLEKEQLAVLCSFAYLESPQIEATLKRCSLAVLRFYKYRLFPLHMYICVCVISVLCVLTWFPVLEFSSEQSLVGLPMNLSGLNSTRHVVGTR